jgi:hypothetical protein
MVQLFHLWLTSLEETLQTNLCTLAVEAMMDPYIQVIYEFRFEASVKFFNRLGQYYEDMQDCILSYDGTSGRGPFSDFEILTGSSRLGTWVTVTDNTIPPNAVYGIKYQSLRFCALKEMFQGDSKHMMAFLTISTSAAANMKMSFLSEDSTPIPLLESAILL